MSHRLLEEPVSYLVLLKSKIFSALGFTRVWEVSRQTKGSTITRHKVRSKSSFTPTLSPSSQPKMALWLVNL